MSVQKKETNYYWHVVRKGVNIGGCGRVTVRLRPTLVFENKHADVLANILEDSLKDLYK